MTVRRLFDGVDGPTGASNDDQVNLGMEFFQDTPGWVTSLWFWRASRALVGPIDLSIWEIDPGDYAYGWERVHEMTAWGEYDTGWLETPVTTPFAITPDKRYRVQAYTTRYSSTSGFWTSGPGASGLDNGPLHAPNQANASFHLQGSYDYGVRAITKLGGYGDHYWVDVSVSDVDPGGGPPPSGPVVQRWDGSAFVPATSVKRWDGSGWLDTTVTKF